MRQKQISCSIGYWLMYLKQQQLEQPEQLEQFEQERCELPLPSVPTPLAFVTAPRAPHPL
jgi:hypothetical protein